MRGRGPGAGSWYHRACVPGFAAGDLIASETRGAITGAPGSSLRAAIAALSHRLRRVIRGRGPQALAPPALSLAGPAPELLDLRQRLFFVGGQRSAVGGQHAV